VAQGEEKEEEKKEEEEKEEDGRMGEGWVIQRLIGHVLFYQTSTLTALSVGASDLDTGAEKQENEAEKEKERKMLGPTSKEELRKGQAHHVRHLPYRTPCFIPLLRS